MSGGKSLQYSHVFLQIYKEPGVFRQRASFESHQEAGGGLQADWVAAARVDDVEQVPVLMSYRVIVDDDGTS